MSRIVIIGAGPTGLGAAYRLRELGHDDWDIYERSVRVGGLAASVTYVHGFTYEIGGHVLSAVPPSERGRTAVADLRALTHRPTPGTAP